MSGEYSAVVHVHPLSLVGGVHRGEGRRGGRGEGRYKEIGKDTTRQKRVHRTTHLPPQTYQGKLLECAISYQTPA